MGLYEELKAVLRSKMHEHDLTGYNISVRFNALSASQAIGTPGHEDYPIMKGKEVMVEAVFEGSRGQAFTNEFKNADYLIDDLVDIRLDSNGNRASFIAGLNAVSKYLNLCDKTIHCRNNEPKECARYLYQYIGQAKKVLLVGYQPRFVEELTQFCTVRVVDMDEDNIGLEACGVRIESPEKTAGCIEWCDSILATGSTVVNGTIENILNQDKPVLFYGVTVSAAASLCDLNRFCHCGH